ncbi:MAG: tagatose 1,6-diphosphate aldolase [Chloroflexi bacterium]|nr:tagatose 1,6-diphosphate aldolase [Chloroflexota bacterium]MDL1883681.1 tagatose 1,6-diphosphate aldolase [Anaerolineae bacterium CFX8]
MKQTLSPGRWRGLKTTSTRHNVFTILAFDQRGTYRKMLPPDTDYDTAAQIKCEVVTALSYESSAILLDSYYGLQAALSMSGSSGLLMALEESGYSGDSTYRRIVFNPNWTVAKIKQVGASAIKLLAYYHPHSGALAEEVENVIARVRDECHQHDITLFLEPVSYSLDAAVPKDSETFARLRPQIVRDTADRLSKLQPDVLKLEFPVDISYDKDENSWRAACEAVSQASDVPWVLLSAGVDFEMFERQTRIACEAGASGFLAGRAIWKESVVMSPEDRQRFLETTASDRLRRLTAITNEYARPWTEFYTPIPSTADWFVNYPALA